jgi:hypothetical protein
MKLSPMFFKFCAKAIFFHSVPSGCGFWSCDCFLSFVFSTELLTVLFFDYEKRFECDKCLITTSFERLESGFSLNLFACYGWGLMMGVGVEGLGYFLKLEGFYPD